MKCFVVEKFIFFFLCAFSLSACKNLDRGNRDFIETGETVTIDAFDSWTRFLSYDKYSLAKCDISLTNKPYLSDRFSSSEEVSYLRFDSDKSNFYSEDSHTYDYYMLAKNISSTVNNNRSNQKIAYTFYNNHVFKIEITDEYEPIWENLGEDVDQLYYKGAIEKYSAFALYQFDKDGYLAKAFQERQHTIVYPKQSGIEDKTSF